ncbi:hypothetical protein FA10DRAFT_268887, partial [Acaromyces ingoldii]
MMPRILRPGFQEASAHFARIRDLTPEYADLFGDDPKPAFAVLAVGFTLALAGWSQLPRPKGLRLIVGYQLIVTALLTFMDLRYLFATPIRMAPPAAGIVGLATLVVFGPSKFNSPSGVVSNSAASCWPLFLTLSGFDQLQEFLMRNDEVGLVVTLIFSMFAVGLLIIANAMWLILGDKGWGDTVLSMKAAASIVILQTTLLVVFQL